MTLRSGNGGVVAIIEEAVETKSMNSQKGTDMLWTVAVILIILWLAGLVGNVGGDLIHIVLVVALVVIALNFLQGRRAF